MRSYASPHINKRRHSIEFKLRVNGASQISLAGSFNNWAQDVLYMQPDKDGSWKIKIPLLPKGTYQYKFFLDDKMWMEDIDNPYREPDGKTGFNSLLFV